MGVPAAMGVRTRAPLWKTQEEMRAEWKAKPVFHFCTANRAHVVSLCVVGGSDRTRSWGHWPEHTRAPFDVQPRPLRAHLPLPGGCCFRGLPWSPSPSFPSKFSPAPHPRPPFCSYDSWPLRLWALPPQRHPQPGATKSQRESEREPGVWTGSVYYHVDRHRSA